MASVNIFSVSKETVEVTEYHILREIIWYV